jgi:hypothetical protein
MPQVNSTEGLGETSEAIPVEALLNMQQVNSIEGEEALLNMPQVVEEETPSGAVPVVPGMPMQQVDAEPDQYAMCLLCESR